ncbi:MAG: glycosyltransferase [Bacteroidaceae bacterium]|nr:glycosyltransferase [Bacteroidaceae bacterium]
MKICMLTPRFPFPENGGDVLRINNIARYLKAQGHTLLLISLSDTNVPCVEMAEKLYDKVFVTHRNHSLSLVNGILYMMCGKPIQCGYYYSKSYKSLLREVVQNEKPDMFISHLLRMTPYLEELHVENRSIVEMTDALSKTYAMSANAKSGGIKKFVYNFEKSLIANYEKKVIRTFPKVVLVSQADVDFLHDRMDGEGKSLSMHTNGVACMESIEDMYNVHKICFIGNMRTLQNQDAVLFFVKEVLPLIKQTFPSMTFYVVGAEPPQSIQALASEDVVVTGFVENLEATIADSCLAVAPVRVAAGIQNKVLVAMGCGLPVVMTPLIAQAIPELKNGENCMIQNDAASIAEQCIRLMKEKELRNTIGHNGYEMVRRNYSWNEKLKGYELL